MDEDEQPRPRHSHESHRLSDAERSAAKILRLKAVMARTGLSRSWVYAAMAKGAFVPSVKIGRATGWDAAAVDAWIVEKLTQGGARPEASK